ncbi:FemAB family XrtA/PEP-CTERM system-associated protein [Microvirga massiliensis]|uniref:FemAB family XrtA/PEP-CTERM system-associated protein n=1 Tax=Microvirga massiliensis TaxID=1033741 RepID=UPI0009E4DA78|nr:FemAB family XrtA/PEP-CTERM system-associated protein [Microvirga massiliensis]
MLDDHTRSEIAFEGSLAARSEGRLRRSQTIRTSIYGLHQLEARLPRLEMYTVRGNHVPLSRHPAWLEVLARSLGHQPYVVEADREGSLCGYLPLAYVRSLLFGRFLVSLPYLNYGGVFADDEAAANLLIDRAVELAAQLGVRYLELRHSGKAVEHPALNRLASVKVHMRLSLPETAEMLWEQVPSKVRNHVRQGQKAGLTVTWGREELLPAFHNVFSRNMRDLGTPTYGRSLFAEVLRRFPDHAELCVVRTRDKAVAGALLLHGWGITEVPSASSLREYNNTNANSLMYWHLLQRAIQRGQTIFDFGRSTPQSGTYVFKKQWGAKPEQAMWQYHLRTGSVDDVRPDNPKYDRMIQIWQRLPIGLTQLIGPLIVRGIP